MGETFARGVVDEMWEAPTLLNPKSAQPGSDDPSYIFKINDIVLEIPPEQITVNKEDLQWQWKTLRTKSSTKVPSGHGMCSVSVNIVFTPDLLLHLHRLIVQLRHSPFCWIENMYLRESIVPHWAIWQNMAFTLASCNISSAKKNPGTFICELDFRWFNYFPYGVNFLFRDEWKTEPIEFTKQPSQDDPEGDSSVTDFKVAQMTIPTFGSAAGGENLLEVHSPLEAVTRADYKKSAYEINRQKGVVGGFTIEQLLHNHAGESFDLLPLPNYMRRAAPVPDPSLSRIYVRYINSLQQKALFENFNIDIAQEIEDSGQANWEDFTLGVMKGKGVVYGLHTGALPSDLRRSIISKMLSYSNRAIFYYDQYLALQYNPNLMEKIKKGKKGMLNDAFKKSLKTPKIQNAIQKAKNAFDQGEVLGVGDNLRPLYGDYSKREGERWEENKRALRIPLEEIDTHFKVPDNWDGDTTKLHPTWTSNNNEAPLDTYKHMKWFPPITEGEILRVWQEDFKHYELDLIREDGKTTEGWPVFAMESGRAETKYDGASKTYTIKILHDDETTWKKLGYKEESATIYKGLHSTLPPYLKHKSQVNRGTLIGWIGAETPDKKAALHVRFRVDGGLVDPINELRKTSGEKSSTPSIKKGKGNFVGDFNLEDFRCKDSNKTMPPLSVQDNLKILAQNLQVLSDSLGKRVRIVSGYRTFEYNKKKGNAPTSQHILGTAADIYVEGLTTQQLASAVLTLINNGEIDDGGVGYYPNQPTPNVHYDVRSGTPERWEEETADVKIAQIEANYEFRHNPPKNTQSPIKLKELPDEPKIDEPKAGEDLTSDNEQDIIQSVITALYRDGWQYYDEDQTVTNIWKRTLALVVRNSNYNLDGVGVEVNSEIADTLGVPNQVLKHHLLFREGGVITDISGGLRHIVASIPIIGHEFPTHQHLGSIEPEYLITLASQGAVSTTGLGWPATGLEGMRATLQQNARSFRPVPDCWTLSTDHFVTRLLGSFKETDHLENAGAEHETIIRKRTAITNMVTQTVPGNPGLSDMLINISETNPYETETIRSDSEAIMPLEDRRREALKALLENFNKENPQLQSIRNFVILVEGLGHYFADRETAKELFKESNFTTSPYTGTWGSGRAGKLLGNKDIEDYQNKVDNKWDSNPDSKIVVLLASKKDEDGRTWLTPKDPEKEKAVPNKNDKYNRSLIQQVAENENLQTTYSESDENIGGTWKTQGGGEVSQNSLLPGYTNIRFKDIEKLLGKVRLDQHVFYKVAQEGTQGEEITGLAIDVTEFSKTYNVLKDFKDIHLTGEGFYKYREKSYYDFLRNIMRLGRFIIAEEKAESIPETGESKANPGSYTDSEIDDELYGLGIKGEMYSCYMKWLYNFYQDVVASPWRWKNTLIAHQPKHFAEIKDLASGLSAAFDGIEPLGLSQADENFINSNYISRTWFFGDTSFMGGALKDTTASTKFWHTITSFFQDSSINLGKNLQFNDAVTVKENAFAETFRQSLKQEINVITNGYVDTCIGPHLGFHQNLIENYFGPIAEIMFPQDKEGNRGRYDYRGDKASRRLGLYPSLETLAFWMYAPLVTPEPSFGSSQIVSQKTFMWQKHKGDGNIVPPTYALREWESNKVKHVKRLLIKLADMILKDPEWLTLHGKTNLLQEEFYREYPALSAYPDMDLPRHPYYVDNKHSTSPDFYYWSIYEDAPGGMSKAMRQEVVKQVRPYIEGAYKHMRRMQKEGIKEYDEIFLDTKTITNMGLPLTGDGSFKLSRLVHHPEGSDRTDVMLPDARWVPGDPEKGVLPYVQGWLQIKTPPSPFTDEGKEFDASNLKLDDIFDGRTHLDTSTAPGKTASSSLQHSPHGGSVWEAGIIKRKRELKELIAAGAQKGAIPKFSLTDLNVQYPNNQRLDKHVYDQLKGFFKKGDEDKNDKQQDLTIEKMFGSSAGYMGELITPDSELGRVVSDTALGALDEYNHAFNPKALTKLTEDSASDILSEKLTMRRAFPTFKLFFVEEDEIEGRWLNFDDFYSFNGVKEFSVHKTRKAPADTATIVLQNVAGTLDGTKRGVIVDMDWIRSGKREDEDTKGAGPWYQNQLESKSSSSINDQSKKGKVVRQEPVASYPFGAVVLRPGMNVQLRCGYANDPNALEVLVSGRVTDVSWNKSGDLAEIVVQSFGAELLRQLKAPGSRGEDHSSRYADAFPTTHHLLGSIMLSPELKHFGRWEYGQTFMKGEAQDPRLDFFDYDTVGWNFDITKGFANWVYNNYHVACLLSTAVFIISVLPLGRSLKGIQSVAKVRNLKILRGGAGAIGATGDSLEAAVAATGTLMRASATSKAKSIGSFLRNFWLHPSAKHLQPIGVASKHQAQLLRFAQAGDKVGFERYVMDTMKIGNLGKTLGKWFLPTHPGGFRSIPFLGGAGKEAKGIIDGAIKLVGQPGLTQAQQIVNQTVQGIKMAQMNAIKHSLGYIGGLRAGSGGGLWHGALGTAGAFLQRGAMATGRAALILTAGAIATDLVADAIVKPIVEGIIGDVKRAYTTAKVSLYLSPQDDNLFPPNPATYMCLNPTRLTEMNDIIGNVLGLAWWVMTLGGSDPNTDEKITRFLELVSNPATPLLDKRLLVDDAEYQIMNHNIWDIFHEMSLRHPGWVYGPRPYGKKHEYRMFFGVPSQRYWSIPYESPLISRLNHIRRLFDKGFTINSVSEDAFKYLYGKATYDELKKRIDLEIDNAYASRKKSSVLHNLFGGGFSIDVEQLKEEQLNRAMSTKALHEYITGLENRFKPFRRYHILSSSTDIVHNGIQASEHNVINAVDVKWFGDKVIGQPVDSVTIKAHANIPEDLIRMESINYPNCRGYQSALRYGMGHLIHSMKEMYRGEVMVLGNPRIRPYDVCFLHDTYHQMAGPIEVEAVTHIFSHETGYLTEIKPNAIVIGNEISSMPVIEGLKVFQMYMLDRNESKQIVNTLPKETREAIGNNIRYVDASDSWFDPFIGVLNNEDQKDRTAWQEHFSRRYKEIFKNGYDLNVFFPGITQEDESEMRNSYKEFGSTIATRFTQALGATVGGLLAYGMFKRLGVSLGSSLPFVKNATKGVANLDSKVGWPHRMFGAFGGAAGAGAGAMTGNTFFRIEDWHEGSALGFLVRGHLLYLKCMEEEAVVVIPLIKSGQPIVAGLSLRDPSVVWKNIMGNIINAAQDTVLGTEEEWDNWMSHGKEIWRFISLYKDQIGKGYGKQSGAGAS